jgi:hypothetical protein
MMWGKTKAARNVAHSGFEGGGWRIKCDAACSPFEEPLLTISQPKGFAPLVAHLVCWHCEKAFVGF